MFSFLDQGTPGVPILQGGGEEPAAQNIKKPLAKSKNPEYTKTGVYLKTSTLRAVKSRLAGDELSNLFEELAAEWLKRQE